MTTIIDEINKESVKLEDDLKQQLISIMDRQNKSETITKMMKDVIDIIISGHNDGLDSKVWLLINEVRKEDLLRDSEKYLGSKGKGKEKECINDERCDSKVINNTQSLYVKIDQLKCIQDLIKNILKKCIRCCLPTGSDIIGLQDKLCDNILSGCDNQELKLDVYYYLTVVERIAMISSELNQAFILSLTCIDENTKSKLAHTNARNMRFDSIMSHIRQGKDDEELRNLIYTYLEISSNKNNNLRTFECCIGANIRCILNDLISNVSKLTCVSVRVKLQLKSYLIHNLSITTGLYSRVIYLIKEGIDDEELMGKIHKLLDVSTPGSVPSHNIWFNINKLTCIDEKIKVLLKKYMEYSNNYGSVNTLYAKVKDMLCNGDDNRELKSAIYQYLSSIDDTKINKAFIRSLKCVEDKAKQELISKLYKGTLNQTILDLIKQGKDDVELALKISDFLRTSVNQPYLEGVICKHEINKDMYPLRLSRTILGAIFTMLLLSLSAAFSLSMYTEPHLPVFNIFASILSTVLVLILLPLSNKKLVVMMFLSSFTTYNVMVESHTVLLSKLNLILMIVVVGYVILSSYHPQITSLIKALCD